MEENRRRRTPKKPEHPVREWISDNLRYFMLFGGILVIIVIAILIVKLLSGSMGASSDQQTGTKAESAVATKSVDTDETDKDHMEQVEATVTPTPTPTVEPQPTEAPAADMTKEVDSSVITSLIHSYFNGLSSKNPDAVAACVDSFSEEDRQQVAENTQITSYKNVEVYTCEGLNQKSRIAFVSYTYTVDGSDAEIPALTEFYVYDAGSNEWKLASDTSDSAIQQKMKELSETEKVQTMIAGVRKQYEQVIAEHPELNG